MAINKFKEDFTIVAEGSFDAKVLNKLFRNRFPDINIKIFESNGYSSALSKAKSLLSFENSDVILVLDTDSVDANDVKQKEDFVNFYINTTINKKNFKVFWAVPEFEIVFLENKKFLAKITSRKLTREILEIAKDTPKRMLVCLKVNNVQIFY